MNPRRDASSLVFLCIEVIALMGVTLPYLFLATTGLHHYYAQEFLYAGDPYIQANRMSAVKPLGLLLGVFAFAALWVAFVSEVVLRRRLEDRFWHFVLLPLLTIGLVVDLVLGLMAVTGSRHFSVPGLILMAILVIVPIAIGAQTLRARFAGAGPG